MRHAFIKQYIPEIEIKSAQIILNERDAMTGQTALVRVFLNMMMIVSVTFA